MQLAVVGSGYVGLVAGACFADLGHDVIVVDNDQKKLAALNRGEVPIHENFLPELLERHRGTRIRFSDDLQNAVRASKAIFVAVGTPPTHQGEADLSYVESVARGIAGAIDSYKVVVEKSTVPVYTSDWVRKIILRNGAEHGEFDVASNPEFLREGTAVKDFKFPSKTVMGEFDGKSGEPLAALYTELGMPTIRTDLKTAEMIKYIDNSWHALKIGFANEIGNVCKSLSVDAHKAMEIFFMDKKLNISPAYLLPGFAFGGSCLPKDLRALAYSAKLHDLELPILTSILPSNELQVARGLRLITDKGHRRIGILGFSFKPGTDDLRESPMIEIIERLTGKGYDVRIYDKNVQVASLVGANRDFILNRIPHISRLMVDNIDAVLQYAETIVIGHKEKEFESVPRLLRKGQCLVDFVRISNDGNHNNGAYDGICW